MCIMMVLADNGYFELHNVYYWNYQFYDLIGL